MNKQKGKVPCLSRGFTIIELIVVIAIIAVLAAIVLVNVTQYINKGKDASARANLATLLSNSTVYFEDTTLGNGSYNGFITGGGTTGSPLYTTVREALVAAGYSSVYAGCNVADCAATSTQWCAMITLKSGKYYCIDSSGDKFETGDSGTKICAIAPGTGAGTCVDD